MHPKTIGIWIELGLLDEDETDAGLVRIHGWNRYNLKDPTAADRARRYRGNHRSKTDAASRERQTPARGRHADPAARRWGRLWRVRLLVIFVLSDHLKTCPVGGFCGGAALVISRAQASWIRAR